MPDPFDELRAQIDAASPAEDVRGELAAEGTLPEPALERLTHVLHIVGIGDEPAILDVRFEESAPLVLQRYGLSIAQLPDWSVTFRGCVYRVAALHSPTTSEHRVIELICRAEREESP